ncbi:MAG: hypothetical protein ACPLPT_05310 [Moorellales bacterium]
MTIEWFNPRIRLPLVSVTQYGLVFNQAAVAALAKPQYVMLGFDTERNLMVVKPLSETDEPNLALAVPFASRERNGSVRLATREFLRFLLARRPDLASLVGGRFVAYWDDKEKALMVDLQQRHQGATRRRRRARAEAAAGPT